MGRFVQQTNGRYMSYETYYIEAAQSLGLISAEDADGNFVPYGVEDDVITSPTDSTVNVTVNDAIISRAKYLDALHNVRETRNGLLANTDWIGLSDVQLDAATKQVWLDYRQALRDCTDNLVEGDEDNFTFPQFPTS